MLARRRSLPKQTIWPGLSRRDVWLLPLISLLTLGCLVVGAELVARLAWPEQMLNACRATDPEIGYRYRGNCHSETKTAEGPWVSNDYNACGYRSAAPCGPTPAGTRRVALIGTSLAEGHMVEYRHSIGARLGEELTRSCGAPVEVQNLGASGYGGLLLIPRMAEALRLRPEAVVLVLAPFDLEGELNDDVPASDAQRAGAKRPPMARSLRQRVFDALKGSRAVIVAQHFLFQDPSVYLPLYLRYNDKADFLRTPWRPNWQRRLRNFERVVKELAGQAHAAATPLTLVFVPQEAQVAMMAGRPVPPGIDPAALPSALKAIAGRHGVGFIDTSVPLRAEPTPERLYYQVDGHLSGLGQPLAAAYIARQLAAMPESPFAACREPATPGAGATQ